MKHSYLTIRNTVDGNVTMRLISATNNGAILQARMLYEMMDKTKLDNICLQTEDYANCLFYREIDCPEKNIG